MTSRRLVSACLLLLVSSFSLSPAQVRQAPADAGMVNRIWAEGIDRSRLMETLSYLTDVIGPRIPGTPAMKKAQDWTAARLKEWGLANAVVEPAGEFGLGWSNEYVSVHMTAPSYLPIVAYPVPWTSGTAGRITGAPILAPIESKADMEKYKGRLKGAIVFLTPPRKTAPAFEPPAKRYNDADLRTLTETPIPTKPEDRPDKKPDAPKWEELVAFFRAEEVGVLVESSSGNRSDYGTVRVDAYKGDGKDHRTAGQSPRLVMAAEHYARICRILKLNVPVTLEIEVRNTIYDKSREGYNVLAEIPGTDKKGELVMLGGHLDSWAGGTGAVDDASGCAVVMEAVRILQVLGVKPRRTIRAALWTGEEEGFYGSRGYVVRHFGDSDTKSLEKGDFEAWDKAWRNPLGDAKKLVVKPDYARISGYFNVPLGDG